MNTIYVIRDNGGIVDKTRDRNDVAAYKADGYTVTTRME